MTTSLKQITEDFVASRALINMDAELRDYQAVSGNYFIYVFVYKNTEEEMFKLKCIIIRKYLESIRTFSNNGAKVENNGYHTIQIRIRN
jgi:hypothetical protein